MKWKICGSCVLAEPLTQRMGQAGSSLGGGLPLLWFVAFFLFVLNTNGQLRWLGQKLLQTVGRSSLKVKERRCEPLLHQPAVVGTAGLLGPVWDCSILGMRGGKDTQTPTAWCCHIAALHSSLFSLRTYACGLPGNSILEVVEPLSLELHISCMLVTCILARRFENGEIWVFWGFCWRTVVLQTRCYRDCPLGPELSTGPVVQQRNTFAVFDANHLFGGSKKIFVILTFSRLLCL